MCFWQQQQQYGINFTNPLKQSANAIELGTKDTINIQLHDKVSISSILKLHIFHTNVVLAVFFTYVHA
jgi:hypothetical protein